MFSRMSFRRRLFLSFTAVILAALLLPALYTRSVLEGELLSDAKAAAARQLDAAAWALEHSGLTAPAGLQPWVQDLGRRLDVRLTFIAPDGVVLADSELTAGQVRSMENHAERPEIVEASELEHGLSVRYSATLGLELIYAATRVHNVAGLPEGTLRLAVPYLGLKMRIEGLAAKVLLAMLLAAALGLVLSWAVTRSVARSIAEMIHVAEGISQGEYHRRLRFFPGQEFAGLATAINAMAGNISAQITTISTQKAQLEAVLNAMAEGVLVLDRRGRILQANPAMEAIAPGIAKAVGKRPLEAILSPELQQASDKVLEGTETLRLQIEPEKDQVYDVHLVPARDGDTDIGALAVFHDISELKRLERVRRDFVANVSHELRTPLTTIKGYAETLIDNPDADPKRARGFLEVLLKNADHMARMVEDLLSLSRLESGRMTMNAVPMDPAPAIAEALRACGQMAEAKGIAVDQDLAGDKVVADSSRLTQVFRNLLENAFKYGPPESRVGIAARRQGGEVLFSVTDSGPGIAKEEQPRVFERFYRVEKHRTKNGAPSTGLGLAICKHIVERLGGRIWIESPLSSDGGATFHFTIPAAAAGPEPSDASPTPAVPRREDGTQE
jgi:two-component system phosphate regulon sensor histidine kinase PhoR